MRLSLLLLALTLPLAGQFNPPPVSRITVTTDEDSVLVAPLDFFTVNRPPYAVIHIPIPEGSGWTDFELKASAVNFVGNSQVFFYHSPDPEKLVVTEQIWTNTPQVYYTDSQFNVSGTPPFWNTNRRAWRQQSLLSIVASLADPLVSEVGGITIIIKDDLREHLPTLVWSYNLLDAIGAEEDTNGETVWRTTWPVDWVHSFTVTAPTPLP